MNACLSRIYGVCFIVSLSLLLVQCKPAGSYNKYLDPELLKIAQLADLRNSDSLLLYLSNKQPLLRIEAAFAFASIRDPKAVDGLHNLLRNPVAEVRAAAAYAIGQTLHPSSIEPLSIQLKYESNPSAIINILEAIGKIGGGLHASNSAPDIVENAANAIFNFERADSIGRNAFAKASFWMHNGGWNDARFMNKLVSDFASQSTVNRRMIASAIGRYRGEWFTDTLRANEFIKRLATETDTLTRVAAMAVAGRTNSSAAALFLNNVLRNPASGREQLIAAVRAAGKNQQVEVQALIALVQSEHSAVAEEACLSLQNKKLNSDQLRELHTLQSNLSNSLQAAIARLLHAQGDTLDIIGWLTKIDGIKKPYERVACIRALGVSGSGAAVSYDRAIRSSDMLEANAYTEAFIESHGHPGFPSEINFAESLLKLISLGDIGITALCAAELRVLDTSACDVKALNRSLLSALEKLQLPQEVETANEIIKTLNVWAISPREEIKVEYNHPIDWNLVKSIPRRQRATIYTSKGIIEIELHVEEAPGSVASFVQLCRDGFYNGKSFHRVVPNFVIQGGCPRGDGMGGTDYTLRSEFRLHDYSTGSVGLASSGPDTESCQWFITHIPTPHLEGRYTIFAHVTSGMSVVDQIVVGDMIERVELR